jgi:hypothetical protein
VNRRAWLPVIARRRGALLAAVAALGGCAHGPIRGQFVLPDRPPQPATLSYESSLFGKTGKLWAALPTGESFTGPYILDAAAPDRTMVSTLAGDRGSSMACRFVLNEPGIGPDKGGAVRCEVSTGGTFEARF